MKSIRRPARSHNVGIFFYTSVMLCHFEAGVASAVVGTPYGLLEMKKSSLVVLEAFFQESLCASDIAETVQGPTCAVKNLVNPQRLK